MELRTALEPWPLICDFPREGGFTSRFVDGSLRRFEISASPAFRRDWRLHLGGRPLPLPTAGADISPLAVRYRLQRLHPCLHPAIDPHPALPLVLEGPGERLGFHLRDDGLAFLPDPEAVAALNPGARPWQGRRRPRDVTVDLRIDGSGRTD